MSRLSSVLIYIFAVLALVCLRGTSARAEILHEQGSLRGFLGGSCPGCAYENWVSHISEGIARPGYNDYGPVSLDPQMNGFGHYLPIPDNGIGDDLIDDWYLIFTALFDNDTARVESLVTATQLDSLYDFVVLQDSARVYYLLREHLNPAYYDTQATAADSSDDVLGSFNAGWGVYVFSPSAVRSNILIEAPHPEDDYITPPISTEVFQLLDAGVLMIAGAGREVLWTGEGDYDNSKSLSDPSRVDRTVFHTAHRAFANYHPDDFTLQLHSYDSTPHQGLKSLVVSAGSDDAWPNEPVMDRCAFDDMISLTPLIAVPGNTAGNHPPVSVNNYYCVWYEGGYRWNGNGPLIPQTWDLMGYGSNRQIAYSHMSHSRYRSAENIIHIEMDEMPDAISDDITVYYRTDLPGPVTFANFQHALDYYRPAYIALLDALGHQPMFQRMTPNPTSVNFGQVVLADTSSRLVRFQNIMPTETIHVTGAFTSDPVFTVRNVPANTFLAPGHVCSLYVDYHPVAPTLTVTALSLATDSGCSSIEIRGSGIAPLISFVPDTAIFDTTEVGVPDTVSVELRNTGWVDMHLSGFLPCDAIARILAPPDSLVPARTDDTIRIEFTPQHLAAVRCSVAVLSDAYHADTAWVYVEGSAWATPAAVNGLTVTRSGNNAILRWPPVTHTTRGVPLAATGYIVMARSTLQDSITVLAYTPDSTYVDGNSIPNNARRFYHVVAYYAYPPVYSLSEPALRNSQDSSAVAPLALPAKKYSMP